MSGGEPLRRGVGSRVRGTTSHIYSFHPPIGTVPALVNNPQRWPCGGCSRRITPGSEYHRDDGNAYHNNCVPLTTTRPLNPPPTAQDAPQQAGKLLAGVGVQLGTGGPQNG